MDNNPASEKKYKGPNEVRSGIDQKNSQDDMDNVGVFKGFDVQSDNCNDGKDQQVNRDDDRNLVQKFDCPYGGHTCSL